MGADVKVMVWRFRLHQLKGARARAVGGLTISVSETFSVNRPPRVSGA